MALDFLESITHIFGIKTGVSEMKYKYILKAEIEVEAPTRMAAEKLVRAERYGLRVVGASFKSMRINRFDRIQGSIKILSQKITRE
jgi:hypothetical protein